MRGSIKSFQGDPGIHKNMKIISTNIKSDEQLIVRQNETNSNSSQANSDSAKVNSTVNVTSSDPAYSRNIQSFFQTNYETNFSI